MTFEMSANTTGYVAMGISSDFVGTAAAHRNTEMFVGWVVDSDGSVELIDTYSLYDLSQPKASVDQSKILYKTGLQRNGRTTVRFARRERVAPSASARLNVAIENRVTVVSWAIGLGDAQSTSESGGVCMMDPSLNVSDVWCFARHTAAGLTNINFFVAAGESTVSSDVAAQHPVAIAWLFIVALLAIQ